MSLNKKFLEYPRRGYGMDHGRYEWSMLIDRPKVAWPSGKKLALWVNVCLQFFPVNQKGKPFLPSGGLSMPYPDLRHFTLREYGNRVGIYRFLKAFDKYSIRPSFAINSRLVQRYPYLLDVLKERGDEIICHGCHMDALHYGGQDINEERDLIKQSLGILRELSGQDVNGWISPDRSESENTPELLVENEVKYFCDWVNDDMPYLFSTAHGDIVAMPLSQELEDKFILMNNHHSEDSYVDQICDACDFLLAESEDQGGRILALNIHPWMLGQPHRIGKLEEVLEYVTSQPAVWSAPANEILSYFKESHS